MMAHTQFVTCEGDDWKAIYRDGLLISEGHHWSDYNLIEVIEGSLDMMSFTTVSDIWLEDQGGTYPLKFSEIPDEAFV